MRALSFDNRFVAELPGDPDRSNRRRQVRGAAWSAVHPTPVAAPAVLAVATDVLTRVGFTPGDAQEPWFAAVLGGNALLPGMHPYAACYGGHQFGNWAGQLGDGRAISLGEVVNAQGERWELQLKGAGPTPYSRTADGRAVLRSSIREFLCSEAMHHLGIPTTRALSLVTTGEPVVRDMFYDGRPQEEPGAIVCRVAPSFVRFGNFEIFADRGEVELLAQLVDFTIARDFPHVSGPAATRRIAWFAEVAERTARLLVEWMRVGFVHGVMNTDNMSILGLTIDYGPYGWLDDFDPTWTPNTTDAHGRRYRFGQQPAVAQWNLMRLADALSLVMPGEALQEGIDHFAATYREASDAMHAAKFGFMTATSSTSALARDGYALLAKAEVDYTRFFRALGELPDEVPEVGGNGTGDATMAAPAHDGSPDDVSATATAFTSAFLLVSQLGDVFYDPAKRDQHAAALDSWLRQWQAQVGAEGRPCAARRAAMHAVNPWFVLRNCVAQEAIMAAKAGDPSLVHTLLEVLRTPYTEQPAHARFAAKRPDWARHTPGCSMLSCSS